MDYTVVADLGQALSGSSVEARGSPMDSVAGTALLTGRPEESQIRSWWWIDRSAQTFRHAIVLQRRADLSPVLHFCGRDISNAFQMREGCRHAD